MAKTWICAGAWRPCDVGGSKLRGRRGDGRLRAGGGAGRAAGRRRGRGGAGRDRGAAGLCGGMPSGATSPPGPARHDVRMGSLGGGARGPPAKPAHCRWPLRGRCAQEGEFRASSSTRRRGLPKSGGQPACAGHLRTAAEPITWPDATTHLAKRLVARLEIVWTTPEGPWRSPAKTAIKTRTSSPPCPGGRLSDGLADGTACVTPHVERLHGPARWRSCCRWPWWPHLLLRPEAPARYAPLTWGQAMAGTPPTSSPSSPGRTASAPQSASRTSRTSSDLAKPTAPRTANSAPEVWMHLAGGLRSRRTTPISDIRTGHGRDLRLSASAAQIWFMAFWNDWWQKRGTSRPPRSSARRRTAARSCEKGLTIGQPPTPTRRCRSSGTTTCSQEVDADWLVEGGQAQAVHPHRPVRVHHVRGLRRHLPVEVHPHGHAPTRSPRRPTPSARATTPATTSVFIIDDDVCTRCALCVDRCPTGVIILGKVGAAPADRRPPPAHQQPRLRLRHAAR